MNHRSESLVGISLAYPFDGMTGKVKVTGGQMAEHINWSLGPKVRNIKKDYYERTPGNRKSGKKTCRRRMT